MNALRKCASRLASLGLDLLGRQDVIEWLAILFFIAGALGYCWVTLTLVEGLHDTGIVQQR